MIANIVKTQLQVIMAKNIVVVSVVILQCLEKNLQAGKMANHLKEIGQDLELNLKNGVTRLLKEIIMELLFAINPNYKIKYLDGHQANDIICATVR